MFFKNVAMLRAYISLAWRGTVAGTFIGPSIGDAVLDDRLARLGHFAVAAALRRQIHESPMPGAIACTISRVISSGAFIPGTAAVVITTSCSRITSAICSRCRRIVSSSSARA